MTVTTLTGQTLENAAIKKCRDCDREIWGNFHLDLINCSICMECTENYAHCDDCHDLFHRDDLTNIIRRYISPDCEQNYCDGCLQRHFNAPGSGIEYATKTRVEVIYSFNDAEQKIKTIGFRKEVKELNEAAVIFEILQRLDARDRDALYKISMCFLNVLPEELPQWAGDGKRYFGV